MDFIKFVIECLWYALGYVVGDIYRSSTTHAKAMFGALGGLLFVVLAFTLIKKYCIDFEGFPKRDGLIPLAILISMLVTLTFFAVIFIFWK